jgi:hypothetical protein
MVLCDSPIALRHTDASLVYAVLIVQVLYYIPQIRQRLASWVMKLADTDTKKESGLLHSAFTNLI